MRYLYNTQVIPVSENIATVLWSVGGNLVLAKTPNLVGGLVTKPPTTILNCTDTTRFDVISCPVE